MRKKFTILTAALALLAMLAVPKGGWADEAQYVFNTDAGIAALGIEKPSSSAGTDLSTTQPYTVGQISMSVTHGGTNTRVWNSSGTLDLRIYKNGGSLTFSAATGYNITGITIAGSAVGNFSVNVGTYSSGSWSNGDDGASSVIFTATNTGKINTITVTYSASGGPSLEESDLALVDAPVELEFDLYDNADAQTISYTTSSTGAVTVSQSDYITATVNANNTITVTPVAVTNGPQTITVNQAADGTYAAGSVTFTVDIEDSTPTTSSDVTFTCGTESSETLVLSKDGVSMTMTGGTWNRTDNYRLYANNSLTISTANGKITKVVFTISQNNFSGDGYNSTTKTWTGNAASLTLAADGGQVRFTPVVVTVETSGTPAPSISADGVDLDYDDEEGTITYSITNPVEGGSITASCDAEWIEVDNTPQTTSTGSIYFTCYPNSNFYAHSATVTLTYTYGDSKATVTKDVTVTQAKDPDANGSTSESPITVSEALEAIDEVDTVSGIYVGGIVSSIVTAYNNSYVTFDMYDATGDEYSLRAYHCEGEDADEVAVGDEVVVYGNLMLYNNSIYELASGCQLVSLIHPIVSSITVDPDEISVNADEHDGTLDLIYENLPIEEFDDFDIQYFDAEGEETTKPDWIEVLVAEQDPEIGEGYVVSYYMLENEGEARTVYFKVYAMDEETYIVYSNLVTINQAAPVAPATGGEYALYTGELVEGDYLIVYDGGAMNTTVTSDRLQYEDVTVNNDVITTDNAAIVWHIAPSGQYWTIYNANADAYAASTGVKNKAQMLADGTDDKALWTVSGTETYEFVNKKNSESNVNANLRKNGTYGFACYAASTGGALSLYKKAEDTYTKDIAGNKWYFIASPVGAAPTNVNALTDLYYYDEQEHYWRNKKNTDNADGFDFAIGKGYLCANADLETTPDPITLTFTGVAITDDSYPVDLEYHANTSEGVENTLAGWNLVGNPFKSNAYIERNYYVIGIDDETGKSIIVASEGGAIAPCTGVMVQAEGEEESVTFTTNAPENPSNGNLQMTVAQQVVTRDGVSTGSTTIDNAIVSFNEGSRLGKFYFGENDANIYIPQNGKEYAIVSAKAQGEMPVNFRATKNGTYTLSINPEGVEMTYLHLIDNMTGANIDLLQTPSYTFNASMNDYESRFKLVFAAGSSTGSEASETFAFFANGELIVSNEGEATLQVVDMTGRILSSQSLNGNGSVQMAAPVGVYVLRLISGNEVKTQKIVVR